MTDVEKNAVWTCFAGILSVLRRSVKVFCSLATGATSERPFIYLPVGYVAGAVLSPLPGADLTSRFRSN